MSGDAKMSLLLYVLKTNSIQLVSGSVSLHVFRPDSKGLALGGGVTQLTFQGSVSSLLKVFLQLLYIRPIVNECVCRFCCRLQKSELCWQFCQADHDKQEDSVGLITEPCGTPLMAVSHAEWAPFTITFCLLS